MPIFAIFADVYIYIYILYAEIFGIPAFKRPEANRNVEVWGSGCPPSPAGRPEANRKWRSGD